MASIPFFQVSHLLAVVLVAINQLTARVAVQAVVLVVYLGLYQVEQGHLDKVMTAATVTISAAAAVVALAPMAAMVQVCKSAALAVLDHLLPLLDHL
jgi:hypothetical protein